jgi:tRNA1Val (adenine37-N6)-methyltransferase
MAGRNTFTFKRFEIDQTGCAMKVGTDGVLLGAWCRAGMGFDESILDIGTGTGLIALQLAQRTERYHTTIDAVEIDPAACRVAKKNFEASEWADRLTLYPMSAGEFALMAASGAESVHTPLKYDHIVTNPPWFVDSLTSPDAGRTTARHTGSLPYNELIAVCGKLLKPDGKVSLILPAGAETARFLTIAGAAGFGTTRMTHVHSTPASGPKRTLLELSRLAQTTEISAATLVIHDEEYRALTRDFYLYY